MRLKNNKGTSDTWTGQMIEPGEYYSPELFELVRWQNDTKVVTDVVNGLLIVSDGFTDFQDPIQGLNYLKGIDGTPKDSDGSPLIRTKMTRSGWHFEPRSIDFTTSKLGSLYNRKSDGHTIDGGTDYGDCTIAFFDANGTDISGQSQATLDTDCVKTQIDWQPQYDMDIIGATVSVLNAPTGTERGYAWVIVAPDIPANMGGSVPFMAGGWNLRFFANEPTTFLDGRGAKSFAYDPVYNSNKFRVIVKHEPGAKIELQFVAEHFRA